MKVVLKCAALVLIAAPLDGFTTIPSFRHATDTFPTAVAMAKSPENSESNCLNLFAAAAVVSASCLAFVGGAGAAPITQNVDLRSNALQSSSIELSATVQTMDMSLPSSYSAISDAKASGVAELAQEENLITGTKKKVTPKPSSKTGGGMSMPTGGTPLTEEEKAALAAERQAAREAAAVEKAALAAEKAAEREAAAAEKAAEQKALAEQNAAEREVNQRAATAKAAERAEAKAAADADKAAKKAAKEAESKFKGAEIIDMGLPSYSDSAAVTGGKSSIFAL
uniref:Uncharacterized protein n=2 Tax=Odontella aurita TaxID=265563 RepID=A0A7S4M6Y1_9STRA|mmetsp:Transcript_13078/g.38449  ORF Transcript_13078/g.38449 Transcript_13078/m.38449 type:complete len:282 (+) Transcript_13078:145-990(+)